MRRIGYRLAVAALALALLGAADEPPDALRRGINITHWFRFPPSREPAALRGYLDDAALARLKRAGFTFVRIPVQPELLSAPEALADAVARVERHGLAVVVALFAADWHLESDAADRAKLFAAWRVLASILRRFDPAATFPELLNEPVFANDPAAWTTLQHQVLTELRTALPANTIVLTGAGWGGTDGLLSLPPEPDPNVIYSFHFYQPVELTALGAYRPGLDARAMAALPFPVSDPRTCDTKAGTPDRDTAALIRFYCAQHWDVTRIRSMIGQAAEWGRRYHVRVFAGEFGASQRLNGPARLAWLTAVREACEQEGLGWALWGYDDSMGLGISPPAVTPRIDPAMMRALGLNRYE